VAPALRQRTGSPGDSRNADSRPPSTRMVASNVFTNSSLSVVSPSATQARAYARVAALRVR